MKVLTKEEAAVLLNVESLDRWVDHLSRVLPPAGVPHPIPEQAKAQTIFAKLLACLLLQDVSVYVHVLRPKRRPVSEHPELLYRYRYSIGEGRTLAEAPVHLFEPSGRDQLASILCLLLYFGWDAQVFNEAGSAVVSLTGGRMEVSALKNTHIAEFAADPASYLLPLAS